MRLTEADVTRLVGLKGRDQILLYLAAHTRPQWWATAKDLASIVGLPLRRARIELGELVSKRLLERKGQGTQVALFRVSDPAAHSDQSDPSTRIKVIRAPALPPTRRTGAGDHAQQKDSDLSGSGSQDRTVCLSEGVQGEPGTDRQTAGDGAELRNVLVERIAKRWQLPTRIVAVGVGRLLNARATERELHAFLADAERGTHPAFNGVDQQYRFGCSCTEERFAIWRKTRERPAPALEREEPRPPRRTVSAVSAREIEEFVRNKLRR